MFEVTTVDDIGLMQVLTLAKGFEDETSHVKVDVLHCFMSYDNFRKKGVGDVLALRKDGFIVGGLGYIKHEDIHYPRLLLVETFWFVDSEHRGGGLHLLQAFENKAAELGCNYAAMIHMDDSHPEQLKRIYGRRGYKLIESHYLKEIQP